MDMLSKSKYKLVQEQGLDTLTEPQAEKLYIFLLHLESRGISVEEFKKGFEMQKEALLAEEKKRQKYDANWKRLMPKCPKCHETLMALPVNTSDGDRISNAAANTLWECPKCPYNVESIVLIDDYNKMIEAGQKIELKE